METYRVRTLLSHQLRIAGVIALLVLALTPISAFAADTRGGNAVVIGPSETIADDLYLAGGTVTVLGTIRGDLVVTGGTVTISGPVQGDVLAAGGTTTLQGPVGRNVRAAGGAITIANAVTQDVVVAGGTLVLGPQARVGRDLLAATGSTMVDGMIARNVAVYGGQLALNGPVVGNVRFDGSTLQLGSQASIGGDLTYASDNELATPPAGVVKGRVQRQPRATPTRNPSPADVIIGWLRALVGLFALGLILVLLFPAFARQTVATLEQTPLVSLLVGFLALIAVPILALLVFGLGLLVGGWWLGLATLAVFGIAIAVGLTVTALFVGTWVFALTRESGIHLVWALLLGVAILLLAGLVPIVGGIAVFVALLFGLGALLLAAYHAYEPSGGAPAAGGVPPGGPPRSEPA